MGKYLIPVVPSNWAQDVQILKGMRNYENISYIHALTSAYSAKSREIFINMFLRALKLMSPLSVCVATWLMSTLQWEGWGAELSGTVTSTSILEQSQQ